MISRVVEALWSQKMYPRASEYFSKLREPTEWFILRSLLRKPHSGSEIFSSSDAFIAVIFSWITVYPCLLSLYVYFTLQSIQSVEQNTISCLCFKIISPFVNKKVILVTCGSCYESGSAVGNFGECPKILLLILLVQRLVFIAVYVLLTTRVALWRVLDLKFAILVPLKISVSRGSWLTGLN